MLNMYNVQTFIPSYTFFIHLHVMYRPANIYPYCTHWNGVRIIMHTTIHECMMNDECIIHFPCWALNSAGSSDTLTLMDNLAIPRNNVRKSLSASI